MKTKKMVFAVLITAILLISAALIVGCINPQDGVFAKPEVKDSDYQIPAKKGIVKINLSSEHARTILPDADDIPAVTNLFFDVAFTADASVSGNTATSITYPPSGDKYSYTLFNKVPFVLTPGTYNILITAYKAINGSGTIAGWSNEVLGIAAYTVGTSVIEVGSDSAPINLMAFSDLGTGSFQYSINYAALAASGLLTPLAYTSQTLEIYNYGTSTLAKPAIPLNAAGTVTTATISLPSGYYEVKVILEANNCQDRVVKNVMHIYPGLTSKYTNNSIPAPNQDTFTVDFSLNGQAANGTDSTYLEDLSGSAGPDYTDYSGRDHQYPISNAGLVLSPGNPTNNGYNFLGWFQKADGTEPWTIATSKVYRDRTLYAKWEPKSGAKFTIAFSIIDSMTITPTVNILSGLDSPADPVSYADILAGNKSITFALSGGTFTDIAWEIGTFTQTGGTTFTINDSSTFLEELVHGSHDIFVSGKRNNAPWSNTISFTFTNF